MYISDYELESPFINAGGVAESAEDVLRLAQTGIGAVLVSTALEAREGNSPNGEVVYYHDPITRITYNSRGLPGKGLVNMAQSSEIREMIDIAHYHNKPLILNFAPVSDDPETEVDSAFQALADNGIEELDGFELNASCPNVISEDGQRHELLSYYPRQLESVIERINDIKRDYFYIGSTLVRISPFPDKRNVIDLGMMFNRTGIDVVTAFNTFPLDVDGNEILQVKGGIGGMSGPGMQDEAEKQTLWLNDIRRSQGGRYDIIGSNGIHDAESVRRRLRLGASAVSGTTLFYESSSWTNTVNNLLHDYIELES